MAFALEAFVHLYAAAKKMYLFSTQSNKKSVNLGTLPVFFNHQTPCDFLSCLFVWKHERIYMEEIWKSEEFVWKITAVMGGCARGVTARWHGYHHK